MSKIEFSSIRVARIAALGIRHPQTLSRNDVIAVCASVLTQRPDKKKPAAKPKAKKR